MVNNSSIKPAVCTAGIVIGAIGAVVYGFRFTIEVVSLLIAAVPFALSLGLVLVAAAARTNQHPKALAAKLIERIQAHLPRARPTA